MHIDIYVAMYDVNSEEGQNNYYHVDPFKGEVINKIEDIEDRIKD